MTTNYIKTHQYGEGRVVKWGFNQYGKIYWLASFPGYGRQFVTGRHLVSIDNLFTSNN